MSVVIDTLSWICLVSGGAFCVIGALGLLRMPDFYTRVHAAGITDTMGAGLLLLGMVLQAGFTQTTIKLAMMALLLLFTNPTGTHALAKAARARGLEPLLAPEEESSEQ